MYAYVNKRKMNTSLLYICVYMCMCVYVCVWGNVCGEIPLLKTEGNAQ